MLIQKKLRLAMIGSKTAGKTTFIHSVYRRFQTPIDGYTLRVSDEEEHAYMVGLGARIEVGDYPLPTSQRASYEFTLLNRQWQICRFSWADHRGDAILGSGKDAQTSQLRTDLKAADGLILFCDSEALQKGREDLMRLDRVCATLGRALTDAEERKAVMILFTKSDLARDYQEKDLDALWGLISAISVSGHTVGALIPVACGPAAHDVHLPLLFLISNIVHREAGHAAEQMNRDLAKSQRWKRRAVERWPFGDLSDWWNGVPSDSSMAESAAQDAESANFMRQQLGGVGAQISKQHEGICVISARKKLGEYCACLSKRKAKSLRAQATY